MPVRAKLVIAALSLALLAAPYCSRAADVDAPGPTSVREATARLLKLATLHLGNPAGRGPEWLRALSRRSAPDTPSAPDDTLLLVLQQDRPDGTDLLTLRYPLLARGALSAYAGAGLNRTVYYAEPDLGQAYPSGPARHHALGAAAQLGAALHIAPQVTLSADVRWAELRPQAALLLAADGPVGADPVSVGVRLGWHFR